MHIKKIYLSWRLAKGYERRMVGILERLDTGFSFRYDKSEVEKAKKEGFRNYTAFPDIDKVYTEGVLEVFSQRLVNKNRKDSQYFFSFWEADKPEYDNFDKLALTQGWLAIDNFELLADFDVDNDFVFITDVAGLSSLKLSPSLLKEGDELNFKIESYQTDPYAVKVLKGKEVIGYIKRGHNRFFNHLKDKKPQMTVKTIDSNGAIKQIFVRVTV